MAFNLFWFSALSFWFLSFSWALSFFLLLLEPSIILDSKIIELNYVLEELNLSFWLLIHHLQDNKKYQSKPLKQHLLRLHDLSLQQWLCQLIEFRRFFGLLFSSHTWCQRMSNQLKIHFLAQLAYHLFMKWLKCFILKRHQSKLLIKITPKPRILGSSKSFRCY